MRFRLQLIYRKQFKKKNGLIKKTEEKGKRGREKGKPVLTDIIIWGVRFQETTAAIVHKQQHKLTFR